VYKIGGITERGQVRAKGIDLSTVERFRYRTRYFTDGGVIGTKDFVSRIYQSFKSNFSFRDLPGFRYMSGSVPTCYWEF
jgi:hypothetical protein